MSREGLGKSAVFFCDRFFKTDNILEFIFPKQRATDVYRATIFVFVTPASGNIEILKREAKRVQPRMTSGAVGVFTVLGKLFANSQILV